MFGAEQFSRIRSFFLVPKIWYYKIRKNVRESEGFFVKLCVFKQALHKFISPAFLLHSSLGISD